MQKINSGTDLRDAILQLESKQTYEEKILREQLHVTYESIKPINLIKSLFKEVVASPDLKADIINTSVGMTAGYLSKKLFEGESSGPLKKLLGTVLMFGITNAIVKNPEVIKSLGRGLFKMVNAMSERVQR